ncbi:hypothetical protein KOE80_07260 [Alcaligenes sp. 13f]|nr:hypothetical protein [Alcaligenes sp. 13f]
MRPLMTQHCCVGCLSVPRVIYRTDSNSVEEVERIMSTEPVDAVISRTVALTTKAITSCSTLKVISKHGVDISNIDVEAATARGIPVYVTPGANAQSVAEMTLGLMYAAAHRAPTDPLAQCGANTACRRPDPYHLRGQEARRPGHCHSRRRCAPSAGAWARTSH